MTSRTDAEWKFARLFTRLPAGTQYVALTAATLLVFAIDYFTAYQVSTSLFYLVPICLGTWARGRRVGLLLSTISSGFWLAADLLSGHRYDFAVIAIWNACVRLGFFVTITILLSTLKSTLRQRNRVIAELERTIREAKTLAGVKPICQHCGRIREGESSWVTPEEFLRRRSDLELATAICPECSAEPREPAGLSHSAAESS